MKKVIFMILQFFLYLLPDYAFAALSELWGTNISVRAKLLSYRSMVRTKVLYAAETIYSTKETDDNLDVFDRQCVKKDTKDKLEGQNK
jgi:hypothetical protein